MTSVIEFNNISSDNNTKYFFKCLKIFQMFLKNVKKIFQKSVLKILHDKKIILMEKN